MQQLGKISAVCVDTLHHALALSACRSMAEHGFAEVLLLTDEAAAPYLEQPLPGSVRVEKIAPIRSKAAYSRFVLRSLPDHVDAEHVLMFQWDGFVLDPRKWSPVFLEYDYIGAPWPQMYACGPRRVGNGGFSLRSRRLLRAVRQFSVDTGDAPEDRVICGDFAQRLEDEFSVRFAPAEVARHFSVEHMTLAPFSAEPDGPPPEGTFGFHGFFNFHLAFDDAGLSALLRGIEPHERRGILASWAATALLVNLANAGRAAMVTELSAAMADAAGMPHGQKASPQQVIDFVMAMPANAQ
jgi:hypothetical protein